MNDYYNYSDGIPIAVSRGNSSPIRNEYQLISDGFDALAAVIVTDGNHVWTGTQDFTGVTWIRGKTPVNAADLVTKAYADALAFSAVLPSQGGNAGKVLMTDGTNASWQANTLGSGATITKPNITSEREVSVALGGGTVVDCDLANHFSKTISGVTTLTLTHQPAAGAFYCFILELTNAGTNFTPGWTLNNTGARPSATLTVAGRDVLGYYSVDGATWCELILQKNV